MKHFIILAFLVVLLTACKKDPDTGDLRIVFEYDGTNQEHVECILYSSWENFISYTFLEQQVSDEYGEVFFPGLLPGWYYFEGTKVFSSQFSVYVMDSVKIDPLRQSNKLSVMYPVN